jgi:hypothetical protein
MKTTGLARYYDTLTPWERLSLLVAAKARGDHTEEQWLAGSAPKVDWAISDHFGLAQGFERLALGSVLDQLAVAALFWRAEGVLTGLPQAATPEDRDREEQLWQSLRVLCHQFVVRADAWKLLCQQLSLDAEGVLAELPGYDSVLHMEALARPLAAFCAEQIRDTLQELSTRPLATAQELAQSMRACLARCLAEWSAGEEPGAERQARLPEGLGSNPEVNRGRPLGPGPSTQGTAGTP